MKADGKVSDVSTSHVASCVLLICPTSRSTASAAMKQLCGARFARRSLPSMPWIAANHKKENDVSVSVAGKIYRPTDATTIELPDPTLTRSTQSSAGTGERSE